MARLLLDTYALVELTRNGKHASKVAREIRESVEVCCSTLNLYETWYVLSRYDGDAVADTAVASIRNLARVIAPDADVCILAARLKRDAKEKIGAVDLITAATAIGLDAVVLTGDPHFKAIKGLKLKML